MGFLDHSTNNIIIDAVLTDLGRERLAENTGQFRIEFFSLGDDEVDYGLIKKFGRTVGKEKIVKNTPVFEAQTRANTSIKHRMLTLPNPSVFQMPKLSLTNDGVVNSVITLAGSVQNGGIESTTVRIRQSVGANNAAPPEGLSDSTFTVFMNDRFLQIRDGAALGLPEPVSRTVAYSVIKGAGQELVFNIEPRDVASLTNTVFATFGVGGTITTPVTVVGDQTGLRLDFKVALNQTN